MNTPELSTTKVHGAMPSIALAALGVVYGDIGTSPLYTVKVIFSPATGVPLDSVSIVGAVSVIFWSLMMVVTLKYVVLLLRADHHGEGGVLALASLAALTVAQRPKLHRAILLLGVAGATLFFGDAVITPAISVLGAVEGLVLVAPALHSYVVPAAIVVLLSLFLIQRFGTAIIGKAFGPLMILWFVSLAVSGLVQIAQQPGILAALNPLNAWYFLLARGWFLFATVGAIVLALTGAEALYADLGHFGRKPIKWAWIGFVLPCLTLNYMGQGALLIDTPSAIDNPFFRMFPISWTLPAVLLATVAAVIASQAVITGAYSITKQAMQLGFLPRMTVRNTSAQEFGQIYLPAVNWLLLIGVISVVVVFRDSSALAGAYGVAVTLTMLITTLLAGVLVSRTVSLATPLIFTLVLIFLTIDMLLVASCAIKFFDGGWLPIAAAVLLFTATWIWSSGYSRLMAAVRRNGVELQSFVDNTVFESVHRADRTAVYLVANPAVVPNALLHNMRHNQVLHDCNVILHVDFHEVPWIDLEDRLEVRALGHGFWVVTVHFGFMNEPDVPEALLHCNVSGIDLTPIRTSWFLSRSTPEATAALGTARWRERLFAAMSRNSRSAAVYFRLPRDSVVELGNRVQI